MLLEYALSEKDYLTQQLYSASKKDSVRKARFRSRIVFPLVLLFWAIVVVYSRGTFEGIIFLVLFSLLWFFAYPYYSAKRYISHYKKYIAESYKGRLGIMSTIKIEEDALFYKSEVGEGKFFINQIEKILEIESHYFLKLKTGESIILPKNRALKQGDAKGFIERLVFSSEIAVEQELDWTWK